MVPGENSLLRTPTISGRACAAVAIIPSPKVSASVTPIRFDIFLLRFARPCKGRETWLKPPQKRLAHVFLTACVNSRVATRAVGLTRQEAEKEKLHLK